jgi:hypothetical protein
MSDTIYDKIPDLMNTTNHLHPVPMPKDAHSPSAPVDRVWRTCKPPTTMVSVPSTWSHRR